MQNMNQTNELLKRILLRLRDIKHEFTFRFKL